MAMRVRNRVAQTRHQRLTEPAGGVRRRAWRPSSRQPTDVAVAPSLPGVLAFMQALWAVVHGLDRTSKRMAKRMGVTGPQRLVLRVVGLFPRVSPGDLAGILHMHPSTLTGILQRLNRQRLLTRAPHHTDGRRAVLGLTRAGRVVNRRRRGTVESAVSHVWTDMSATDRAAAIRVLDRLARRLGGRSDGRVRGSSSRQ